MNWNLVGSIYGRSSINSRNASVTGEFQSQVSVTWFSLHFLWKRTFNPSVKIRRFTINMYAWNQLKYSEDDWINRNLLHDFSFYLTWPLGHLSYCHHFSSVICRPSTFHIKIFSSETTGPIATKLWWNDPWMVPFQNCVRWSRLPTKMATKLKIEKGGMKF